MRKVFPIFLALIAVILYGCSGGSSSQDSSSQEAVSQEEAQVGKLIPEEDSRPPIVLKGEGYQLELPAFATDVQCEPVSEVREFDLMWQGHDLIVKPISVTRNGDNHVQLGQPATVRFAIPEDVPEDQYDELVGMLFTDHGTEYKIPDYYALREGFVQFETSHFCDLAAGRQRDALRELFIEKVAVNGWGRNMSNKDMEPTLRAQINKFAEDHCLGENDLVGIAMREVFGEKDFVKIGLDIVNAYDMENASLEERMAVASETMIKLAKGKVLSYFIKKLKVDENKKVKVMDELKSEKIGETVYKTELHKIDSRRNKIIGVLEDHFKMENAEKVGTTLGSNPTFEECYILAWQYITEFAKEKTKEALIEMIPYLGYLKQMATAVEIWKKFWAATQMQDLYREYEKKANEKGALLDDGEWGLLTMYISAPKFLHGMTDKKMKDYIEQRYLEKKEIERRKEELREYIDMIEKSVDLKSECFEQKHFDYVQRLTVVRNLIDRFYYELVGDDGYLTYIDNGYRQAICTPNAINQQLCYVVDEYLKCYPNREKFYVWLDENGYDYGQLEDEYKKLDALLWKEEPEPEIRIAIQESTNGASSGGIKYAGHTICLGTNGKPYKDWHRNIPDEDWVYNDGWSTEFPREDSIVLLSEYKEIGMPNQVLIYANEKSFLNGGTPVATFDFKADTTDHKTVVELNPNREGLVEYGFDTEDQYCGISYHTYISDDGQGNYVYAPELPYCTKYALMDALSKAHIYLKDKGDKFSFTTYGESSSEDESAEITLTVEGEIDFSYTFPKASCTIKATVDAIKDDGTRIKAYFNLTGLSADEEDENGAHYLLQFGYHPAPVRIECVTADGQKNVYEAKDGNITFHFLMMQ